MISTFGPNATIQTEELRVEVRRGIRALAQTAETVLEIIRKAGNLDFTPSAYTSNLGAQLASMLKQLRAQRSMAAELSMRYEADPAQDASSFEAYMQALNDVRLKVGLWITVQASAKPEAMRQDALEFETQCFTALGAGIMWLDGLANQEGQEGEEGLAQERLLMQVFVNSQRDELPELNSHSWTPNPAYV